MPLLPEKKLPHHPQTSFDETSKPSIPVHLFPIRSSSSDFPTMSRSQRSRKTRSSVVSEPCTPRRCSRRNSIR